MNNKINATSIVTLTKAAGIFACMLTSAFSKCVNDGQPAYFVPPFTWAYNGTSGTENHADFVQGNCPEGQAGVLTYKLDYYDEDQWATKMQGQMSNNLNGCPPEDCPPISIGTMLASSIPRRIYPSPAYDVKIDCFKVYTT
jgi:hypothetical protein